MNKKIILITGGTGSFGSEFLKFSVKKFKNIKKIIIFSRDELKQYEMQKIYPKKKYPFIRFFLGDVRDYDRLFYATKGVNYIIHAAALKHVPAAEYNPYEFIKTNVIGAENISRCAIENNVSKVIALSTDKAVSPLNLYGATKLCSDKILLASNHYKGKNETSFSIVRYGNVASSRGSVIPLFKILNLNQNYFPITDLNMTRFNISLSQSVEMVYWAINNTIGGEIVVPKIPSIRITDLAKAINPQKKIKIIGIRPGEKISEDLISSHDSFNTIDIGKYYLILDPIIKNLKKYYKKKFNFKKVSDNFVYNSSNNKHFLTISEIKKII
jgi:UDP-N-acetylglucosamine 4,6-dehydratase